jgi:hypothetical protein
MHTVAPDFQKHESVDRRKRMRNAPGIVVRLLLLNWLAFALIVTPGE